MKIGKVLLAGAFVAIALELLMRFYPTIVFDLDPQVQEVLLLTQKTIQIYFTLTQFVLLCFGPWILYTIGVALFTPYRKVCPIEESECAPKDMAGRVRRAGQLLPPYPNGWFRVLHSQELKVGEVKEVQLLGQVLAVFRGEDGKARALDAFCTHLGASLAIKGTVCGNNLRCPFHGWEFEGDGTCAKIPYTEKIPSVANTKSWLVEECNSMIFVWHHADKEEPYWDCPYIEVLNNGAFVYHGHTEHEVSAHIQEIPENGADVAHLNILHTNFVMDWLSPVITHYWTADWKAGTGAEAHLAHITLTQCLQFFGWTIPGTFLNVTITQAGPGIVHLFFTSPVGKLYVMETVTPLRPMLQKATHTIWAEWKLPRFIGKIVLAGLVRQFERDIPIWNNKTFLKKPTIVKGDGAIGQFRRWYSQFYSESSFELAKKIQESSLSW